MTKYFKHSPCYIGLLGNQSYRIALINIWLVYLYINIYTYTIYDYNISVSVSIYLICLSICLSVSVRLAVLMPSDLCLPIYSVLAMFHRFKQDKFLMLFLYYSEKIFTKNFYKLVYKKY